VVVQKGAGRGNTYLRPVRASIPRHVPHDLCEIFRVLDDKDVPKHLEVVEIRGDTGNLEWTTIAKVSEGWETTGTARHLRHIGHTLSDAMNAWYAFRSAIT
jgi:hypothetical protein